MASTSDEEAVELTHTIKEIEDATPPGQPQGYARFAAEFGRRYYELQRDRARWVLEQMEHAHDTEGPG